jgi:endonuclease/exonuclease/phosphatase family metal-dependent hydrolase
MKKIGRSFGVFITVITVLLFLLSSATAYISPADFPLVTFLSISYLPILVAYILVTLCWLFYSKRVFGALLLLLFAGYKNLSATVAVNVFAGSWNKEKAPLTIRVMSWNVNMFGDPFVVNDTNNSIRRRMLNLIHTYNPDILCVQDLAEKRQTPDQRFVQNIKDIMESAVSTSAHYSFFYEFEGYRHAKLGTAIFSRLPVIDTGSFFNNGANNYERTGFIDVLAFGKTIRIINSHFSSMSLWPSNKQQAGINYLEGDSTKTKVRSIIHKITDVGAVHVAESKAVKSFIDNSAHSVLFCADLNAVPSGFIYHHLRQNLNDAFLEKDYGFGGTYNRIFPKLRIDVLLHSKELEVVQFIRPAVDLSDHYPIIADIRWKQ